MASKEPIENVYTKNSVITKNALFTIYEAEINLDKFDYDMLYAYTQVNGLTLNKRALEAEKFAQKLSEKNLDSQTIRTILETQNIKLPSKSATFIESNNSFDNKFFINKHNLFLYTQHPNLITIYASGKENDKVYVTTESLENRMPTEKLFETFTIEGKINLIIQVSRAVASLHSNKIIHQNICPENIFALLQPNGICQIKLLASGIIPNINSALDIGGGSEFKPLFAFTAPETLSGINEAMPCNEKEDIYALGGLLFFYLSGQRPWQKSRTLFDIIKACKDGETALNNNDFSNINDNLKSVIIKATHINPELRYNNIAELISDLEACRDGNEPNSLAMLESASVENNNVEEEDNLANNNLSPTNNNKPKSTKEEAVTQQKKPEPTQTVFKSEQVLTEEDLPQPLIEPQIPDINEISPELNKTSSQIWKKLAIAACILLASGGAGYYFLTPKSINNTKSASAQNLNEKEAKDLVLPVVNEEVLTATDNNQEPEAQVQADSSKEELAKKEQEKKEKLQKLEEEKRKKLEADYQSAIASGNQAMKNKEYELAIIEFSKASEVNNTEEVTGLLQVAKLKRNSELSYEKFLNDAKELLNQDKLEEAEAIILQAKNISDYTDDPRTDQIINNIRRTRFENALAEGEKLLSEENYEEAELAYAWALSIPGYENNSDAINGRQLAQETLKKIAEQQLKKEAEERNRKAQYSAAITEAEKLLTQNRWDEAASAFKMALEVPGYSEDITAQNGIENALQNKQEEESRLLEAKNNALKAEYNRLINNGNSYLNAGMWRKAEESFSNALKIEGYSASKEAATGRKRAIENNRLKTNREQYDKLILDGMEHILKKDYPGAEKAFRDALLIPGFDNGEAARQAIMFAENFNAITAKATKYNNYLDSGKKKLLNNDPKSAIRDFGRAIVEAPKQIDAYILRGSAYLEAGNSEKALSNFEQALEIDPNYEPAIIGKAITFVKNEDYKSALKAFELIASNTKNLELKAASNNIMGWIYLETDDKSKNDVIDYNNEEAKHYFELNKDKNDPIALNNLGYMYMKGLGVDKDESNAVNLFKAAAEKGLPEAEFNLGMAYYKGDGIRRNYEDAFSYFKDAADSNTLPIAWGQVAEMYRKGRGVKKDKTLVNEYAAKYNGKTNRKTVYLINKPKIKLPLPVNYLPVSLEPEEFEKQYLAFSDLGRKLTEMEEYDSAKRMYNVASMVEGYNNSEEIKQRIAEIQKIQKEKKDSILAEIIDVKNNKNPDDLLTLTDESLDDISKELAALTPGKEQNSQKTELEDILDSLEAKSSKKNKNNSDDLLTDLDTTINKKPVQDISENRFGKEYVELINIAEKFLSNQEWVMAEQAFRLALALPNSPDQGDAQAGLNTAVRERESANSASSLTISNYAAILGNATALLKEAQWPQAIYMYKSAIEYSSDDDDTLAQLGLKIAETANSPIIAENDNDEVAIKSDERDIASHNMAIAQAKQFLADGNFTAAIQMLEIALSMKGFKEDPVASAMLVTAKKMQLENSNSPEAIAAKRAKNKPIYDKLIKSGELQISTGNLEGAKNSYELASKIPGYEEDKAAKEGLEHVIDLLNRPAVSAELKEKYNTLMNQGRTSLEEANWSRAEETFRVILSLPEFNNDPDALAGLRAAAKAQNKPLPQSGDVTEDILQNGLIPADADLDAIRRRAEFEALIREGKRQLELKQFEVAEAMFNEALKIKGYENNTDGLTLLRQTIALKPKQEEVQLPDHQTVEENPQLDMQHQASMLLEEGNRLRAQKQFDKAIQAYNSGIDLDPNNLKLYINRADTNAGIGNFDEALNDYLKVLDSDNTDDEIKSYTWNNIANVYYYGKKDYASAVEYYTKAAEIGNLASMNSLGVCYGFAKGVEKNPDKSLQWYTKAAEGGYGNAMLNLGMMYQNGWGIDTNLELAREWYEKAAEHNVPRAFIRLSLMYANGSGVEQDQAKADEYKQKAVELGYTADR